MMLIDRGRAYLVQYRNLVLYTIIGGSGVMLDLIFFVLFFDAAHIDKNIATFMSASVGIINNFLWNAHMNFKVKDSLARRFAKFYAVGMAGILLTLVIFWVFVDRLGINANIVKLGSLFPVLLLQYSINKFWTFKKASSL